eukprot:1143983-Pelagomonas_calceolata.AAC.5
MWGPAPLTPMRGKRGSACVMGREGPMCVMTNSGCAAVGVVTPSALLSAEDDRVAHGRLLMVDMASYLPDGGHATALQEMYC